MAQRRNFLIDQGADFSEYIEVRNSNNSIVDLSASTIVGRIRKHYQSNTYFELECSANSSVVTIELPNTVSANMDPGRYMYNVEATSTANVITRIVQGIITIDPKV